MIENSLLVDLHQLTPTERFVEPEVVEPTQALRNISYKKPEEQLELAKKVLAVSAARDVGEKTFDYFYERECHEDE